MIRFNRSTFLLLGVSLFASSSACAGSDDSGSNTSVGNDEVDGAEDETTAAVDAGDGDGASDGGSDAGSDGASDGGTDGVDTGDGGTAKFDVLEIPDAGFGGVGGGPGSCRESEIYGAAGAFPQFEDPAYAPFLDKTVAIVTHNVHSGNPADNVLTIVDISGDPPPPNMNYNAPRYWREDWDQAGLGKIFGITLDSEGNIYVAQTTVYGGNPAPNTIKRIDGITGEISTFATLPNNGPAFGNLNYDCVSESIYVSNHEDGRIYQLGMDGDIVSTYHHATGDVTLGAPNDPGEPNGSFFPVAERPWAVQSHAGRLYYSLWGNKQIWSVGYVDDDGVPDPDTAKNEFNHPANSPVSDLGFAHDGWMLIAQRSMSGDTQTSAHQSTTFDYAYQNGMWVSQGTNYVVGELLPYSAAGGVDHDFVEGGYVWMTGDALDFYTPNVVYGLQGTPYGGGGVETSTLIDMDGEIVSQDKTVYGDVELPIPGDVSPVPPPG
ncbi:hypothetical protein ACNOYE_05010 [Nannocystaceae bacterium ST9]